MGDPTTAPKPANPPLLIYHPRDKHIDAAVEPLTEMSALGMLGDVIIAQAPVGGDAPGPDLRAWVLAGGAGEEKPLDAALADSVAADRAFLVLAAASCGLSPEDQESLARAAERVAERCDRLLPDSAQRCRMFFPEFPDDDSRPTPVSGEFFAADTVNLVAVPMDSDSDDRMGMPVTAESGDLFACHVAVEAATAAGAWRCVAGGLGIDAQSPGMVGESLVRFVSSKVVSVRLAEGAPDVPAGELPVPENMAPLNSPPPAVGIAAGLIPEAITRPPALSGYENDPAPLTVSEGLRLLPRALTRSWSRRHIVDRVEAATSARMSEIAPPLGEGDLPETLTGLEPSACETMSARVCGLIDGGARDGARLLGPHMAIPERAYFTREGLAEDIVARCAPDPGGGQEAEPGLRNGQSADGRYRYRPEDAPGSQTGRTGTGPDDHSKQAPAGGAGGTGKARAQQPDADEPSRGGAVPDAKPGDAESKGKEKGRRKGTEPSTTIRRPSVSRHLLESVGERLHVQAAECRQQAQKLRDGVSKSCQGMRQEAAGHQPPAAMFRFLAVAMAIGCVVVICFTPLYRATDTSQWFDSAYKTERLLAAVVTVAAVWLAMVVRPSDPGRSMLYKTLVPVAAVGAFALFWLFGHTSIWNEREGYDEAQGAWIAGLFMGMLYLLVIVHPLARSRPRERELALTVTAWLGVFVAAFAYNYEEAQADDPRSLLAPFSWLTLLMAVLFVSAAYALVRNLHQAERAIGLWWAQTGADLDNADSWADKSLQCAALRVKWAGAAVSLDYLIRRARQNPGTPPTGDVPKDAAFARVRRFRMLERSISPPQPPRGWLMGRYRQAAAAYQSDTGLDPLATDESVHPLPDLASWRSNRSDPHLDFADRMRSGDYDQIVRSQSEAAPARLDNATIEALAEIVPHPGLAVMPIGFLNDMARARIAPLRADGHICWLPAAADISPTDPERPDEVRLMPSAPFRAPADGRAVTVYQAVRASVSKPLLLSDIGWAEPGADTDPPFGSASAAVPVDDGLPVAD